MGKKYKQPLQLRPRSKQEMRAIIANRRKKYFGKDTDLFKGRRKCAALNPKEVE